MAAAGLSGCRPVAEGPSIVLIVADTLRADHVGAVSPSTRSVTPALDRWAAAAARFRRASTPAPLTMPAVAAMFTGVYPDRSGVIAHEPGTTLAPWKGSTLAEAARHTGFATAAVVANPWLVRPGTGFDRGFDEFSRIYQPDAAPGASDARAVTDQAIRLLQGFGPRRFLLWLHYFDPHMPYTPPAAHAAAAGAPAGPSRVMRDFDANERDLLKLYKAEGYGAGETDHARRLYEGEVRYLDDEIGRLLSWLDESGAASRTLVVIASDHGESLGEHGLYFAHDFTLYEELTRAVLLLRGPGVPSGDRDTPVSLLDVTPTLCRLASLSCFDSAAAAAAIDGRDLLEPPSQGRTLYAATTPRRSRGTPFDRLSVDGPRGRWTMALRGDTKLIRIPTGDGAVFERYDLADDPAELSDLARGTPAERNATGDLAQKLDGWIAEMESSRPPVAGKRGSRRERRDERTLRSLGYLQ